MSTLTLIVTLVGALLAPSSLPPERGPEPAPDPLVEPEPDRPPPTSLPPGLQPIPFPLENQRRAAPPTGDAGNPIAPTDRRRSIVDLRDPFNRPPARPRTDGQRDPKVRLLMPDLKDPFAPGVRRVRSKTLDLRVPNDIRDPFRSPPPTGRRTCAKTTDDGTVVQKPGKKPGPKPGKQPDKTPVEECPRSSLDLRDPFDRDPSR